MGLGECGDARRLSRVRGAVLHRLGSADETGAFGHVHPRASPCPRELPAAVPRAAADIPQCGSRRPSHRCAHPAPGLPVGIFGSACRGCGRILFLEGTSNSALNPPRFAVSRRVQGTRRATARALCVALCSKPNHRRMDSMSTQYRTHQEGG